MTNNTYTLHPYAGGGEGGPSEIPFCFLYPNVMRNKSCVTFRQLPHDFLNQLQLYVSRSNEVVRVRVFYPTFNNSSALLWQIVLLMGEIVVPGENPRTVLKSLTNFIIIMLYRVHLLMSGIRTHNVSVYRH